MAQLETWLKQDLQKTLRVQYLGGTMFTQDNAANFVGVEVFDNGEPASLSGSVSANVIRSDGGTVAVSGGTISGNRVSVVLPQAAYAIPGPISIIIKLTSGTTVTTLGALVVTVYKSSTDVAVDPGTIIPSIQTLISQIETAVASIPADYSSLWTSLAPAFSDTTAYSAGQYFTHNGHLYRFTADHAAGSFVNTDCTQVSVGNELYAVKSALGGIEETIYDGYRYVKNWANGSWTSGRTLTDNTKRIRPATYVFVKAGDVIAIKNGSFKHSVCLWKGTLQSYSKEREDNSLSASDETYLVPVDGFFIVTFGNATNPDLDVNPADFDGSISITSYAKREITWINDSVQTNELQYKNLIGMVGGEKYPVNIPTNTVLTMSTADGTAIGQNNLKLLFLDEDGEDISSGGWAFTNNQRTITTGNGGKTAKYVMWNTTPAKDVQLEFGYKTPYVPYHYPIPYKLTELKSTDERIDNDLKSTVQYNELQYKNLIGMEAYVKYPVSIPTGSTLIMSTADGATYGSNNLKLLYLDENGEDISGGGWNFLSGYTEKVMTVVNGGKTAKYVMWNTVPAKNVQLEFGSKKTAYVPYHYPVSYELDRLKNTENEEYLYATSGMLPNGTHEFTIGAVSDTHSTSKAVKQLVDYMNHYKKFFDCGVHLGDIRYYGFHGNDSDASAFNNVISNSEVPFFPVVGNHDSGSGNEIAQIGTTAEVYTAMIQPNLTVMDADEVSQLCCYYKDFSDYNIRFIVINQYDFPEDSAGATTSAYIHSKIFLSDSVISWLIDTLQDVPDDYGVILACHAPVDAVSDNDDWTSSNKQTLTDNQHYSDMAILPDIINAWQNSQHLTKTYQQTDKPDTNVVDADFTGRSEDGNFICFLTGHHHADFVGKGSLYESQRVISLNTSSMKTEIYPSSDTVRIPGEKSEELFTVIGIDQTNRKIKLYRYGANTKKDMKKRIGVSVLY